MARGRPRCEFPVYPPGSSLTFCSTGPEMPITNVHSYLGVCAAGNSDRYL